MRAVKLLLVVLARARGGRDGRAHVARTKSRAAAFASPAGDDATFSELCSFVRQHGGHVDDALRLAAVAPCGARGLVAAAPLSAARARAGPLAVVPARCVLDGRAAVSVSSAAVPARVREAAPLDTLDDGALVTLLLARERARGPASFWAPYLASLPAEPPCAWWGDEAARAAKVAACRACASAGERAAWAAELERAAAYAARVARGMGADYGDALGVDARALEWSLATLSSRSMGGQARPCLVPLLDLVNHDCSWHAFTGHHVDELPTTFVVGAGPAPIETGLSHGDWAYWAWDADGATPRPREPGDELYANYLTEGYTPFEWFMNLGYVPPEALAQN